MLPGLVWPLFIGRFSLTLGTECLLPWLGVSDAEVDRFLRDSNSTLLLMSSETLVGLRIGTSQSTLLPSSSTESEASTGTKFF